MLKLIDNTLKFFAVLLSTLKHSTHNYFNDPTKLFSDLIKFLDIFQQNYFFIRVE